MKLEKIEIRNAEPEDLEEVYELILAFSSFQKASDLVNITPEQLRLDMGEFNCLVVSYNGKLIGFASFCFTYHSWSGKAIYLDDIFLLEEYRRKGIGTLLFERVKAIGRKENCFKMEWRVSDWNSNAREFYAHKGSTVGNNELFCELKL